MGSNAEISDLFVYRIVYRIEPPISNISIFSKPMIFLSFFAENSKNSPKILKICRKFSENSPKILKIRRKFLKKKVFFEALISYRIVSYREKNPHIVSISYRIEKKAYRYSVVVSTPGMFLKALVIPWSWSYTTRGPSFWTCRLFLSFPFPALMRLLAYTLATSAQALFLLRNSTASLVLENPCVLSDTTKGTSGCWR